MFLKTISASLSRTMGRSTIRAKMYRSSSHRDVRYDGQMRTVDKGEGGDKTEGAITCGEMRADGWGQYRYEDDDEAPQKALQYTSKSSNSFDMKYDRHQNANEPLICKNLCSLTFSQVFGRANLRG